VDFTERPAGKAVILAPAGRVDMTTSDQFRDRLLALVTACARTGQAVVLDFAAVDYISSAGLRVLLMAAKRLKEPPGGLVLCGMGPSVRTVLELAGFLPLFTVEARREQALARLGG